MDGTFEGKNKESREFLKEIHSVLFCFSLQTFHSNMKAVAMSKSTIKNGYIFLFCQQISLEIRIALRNCLI